MQSIATVLIRVAVVALTTAGFALTGPQPRAQELPASQDVANRDHIRQESVQVIVTDRTGHVVTGLRAADFHILEDGVPQQIASLTEGAQTGQMEAGREGAKAGPNGEGRTPAAARPKPDASRTYVICVDALYSSAGNSTRVRDALSKYFRINKKSEGSLYKLVVLGRQPVVVQEFTTDTRDVMEAIRGKEFQSALHEGASTVSAQRRKN